MKYDPKIHHRRSIRLKGYNYANPGWYFVTACTYQRKLLFGDVIQGQMRPSVIGSIVRECWNEIPQHFPTSQLDVSIVMPNHLHGIILIGPGTPWRPRTDAPVEAFGKPAPASLATFMRLFKQAVTVRARAVVGTCHDVPQQIWHENYYEHIIRNEDELNRIREYICDNPSRWPYDPENPERRADAVDEIEDILSRGQDYEP